MGRVQYCIRENNQKWHKIKYKILIIGFGSIGRRHFSILKELLPDSEFAIVTKQDISSYNVKSYKNIESIRNLSYFNYVIIASETYLHYEHLKIVDNYIKDGIILVEKPLFHQKIYYNPSNKNKIFVGYNLRFHPILQKIKNELKNINALYFNAMAGQYLPTWRTNIDYRHSYSSSKEKGGGVVLDLSHEIDYLQWLAGTICEICGYVGKISDLEINCEDIVSIFAKTKKNSIINISLDYISKIPIRKLIIHTKNRTFYSDFINNELIISDAIGNTMKEYFPISMNFTYYEMHKEILSKQAFSICTYEEALKVMNTIELIDKLRYKNV